MTTFDAAGRMTSCFIPPMKNGKATRHSEWLLDRVKRQLDDGESPAETIAWLERYRANAATNPNETFLAACDAALAYVRAPKADK